METELLFLVDAVDVESLRIEPVSFVPSSCTLSREEADIRFAVSDEDLFRVFSLSGLSASSFRSCVISEDCVLDPRGVEGEEGGR